MVGMMGPGGYREQALSLFNDAKLQDNIAAKTEALGRLKETVLYRDTSLLAEFLPHLMEFHTDAASPVRSNVAQIIEEIGLKHLDYIASMVPILQALLRDSTPAVVRRAVTAGSNLFRITFEQVAKQGIYSGHVDNSLQNSWVCGVGLKDAMYATAKEHGNDGVRLLTIKFVEMAILLFTPDPNKPAVSPLQQNWDGNGFNISWIVGGHPVLDVERLGREADECLTYLLEQLSEQAFCKLSGPVAIVLVNSLATIAKRRPAMYGLIIPALSRLGSICEGIRGPQRASIIHAVKNSLVNLLRCTHAGAGIWRERLAGALKAINAGDLAEAAIRQTDRLLRNAERERAFRDLRLSKEEKLQPVDYKRPLQENGSVPSDLNVSSAKRLRVTPETTLSHSQDAQAVSDDQGAGAAQESSGLILDSRLTPLQQMIAMIGALVAKGERAASSIEILITSLPADMLADVVIENMKNLPPSAPAVPPGANTSGALETQPSTAAPPRADAALPPANVPEPSPTGQAASDHRRDPRRDPRRMDPRRVAVPVGTSQSSVSVSVKIEEPAADSPRNLSSLETVPGFNTPTSSSQLQEVKAESISTLTTPQPISSPPRNLDIPSGQETANSLEHPVRDDVVLPLNSTQVLQPESVAATAPTLSGLELSSIPDPMDIHNQIVAAEPMDVEEAAPVSSVTAVPSELATASQIGTEGTLATSDTVMPAPAMTIPVMYLDEDRQLALWKVLLLRILERYVLPGSTGGSGLRSGLLCRLVSQSMGDDEAVTILQNFILADYQSHKGHELAMHMLYQLCTEKMYGEDDGVASEVYEKFLIAVAQGLRDTLPPADKSLSRLLSEAPVIPNGALKWLESICNPSESDPINGERIFQALSAIWILILLRPPIRVDCLEIALKCAVHELDEVRTKAIRLVANKLYPLTYVSQRIEEFAISMLHTVVGRDKMEDGVKKSVGHEALPRKQPIEQVVNGGEDSSTKSTEKRATGRNAVEGDQYRGGKSHVTVGEAQRCMSLYFALCTKKVPLLRQLFDVYEHAPKAVRQAAHRNMPVLVRTIGSTSSDLLQLLSDPPLGSKNLLLLVLHLVTDADAPSPALIAIVKKLYESKIKDARLLTPILSSLSKAEVLPIFPHLVALPSEDFKAALDRILQGSIHTGPALTPAEVLVAIHAIDPDRDQIPLAMVKDACAVCFQQRTVFTQQVLAKVLKQLVEQTPVPMLFMRTVILAVGSFRSLVSFVMEILSRLVSKQIWKWPNLWIGFLKCADQTQPHSFPVLLQLPAAQLEKALHKHPNLRAPLIGYANKQSVRAGLPKPTLVVLGLLQDTLPSEPASYGQAVPDVASTNVTERQMRESAATL
ncbi:hypothetical protein GOP47_0023914 [Adiantum capillus-veneris]|uniref:Symplekin n=1 Tax=Adiantum capillus-veneris TaxID=13818 RepID=A0A9D4U6J8_ADICA|nr:hypothetical protein GOP47_0023914 [Adiantum capillus-veneris]